MAKTLRIYPIQDVTLNHSCSSGSTGYNLINNATSDGDSSYIYQTVSTSSSTKTSTFKCGDNSMTNKIYLISVESTVISGNRVSSTKNSTTFTSNITPGISINGGSVTNGTQHSTNGTGSTTTSYTTFNDTYSSVSGLNRIYNSINDANIRLQIKTTASINRNNDYTYHYRITSGNITIEYDDVFTCQAVALTGSGIVSANVSDTDVRDGGTCTFSCTLQSNYSFSGWYSDADYNNLVSSNQSHTTTITSDTTLYAKASPLYNITVYGDSNCTVSSNKNTGYYNEQVTVTATVSDNVLYMFDGWYSNPERTTLVSMNNPYIFEIKGDTTLYARTKVNEVMFMKINGHWNACREVYVKIDGHWELQDEYDGIFDTTKNYQPIQI